VPGRAPALAAVAAIAVLAGFASASTGAFCELVFKDVAETAPVVVLAEYETSDAGEERLRVIEVVKGPPTTEVRLRGGALHSYRPERGDRFLLALTRGRRLVEAVPGLGACRSRSVLAIRKGKVRAVDRRNWDGSGSPPPLERMLAEIRAGG
jgi:hypothetical protein